MSGGFALVVLAGGEGSRIGGDKPLRRLAGETLIERTLRRVRGWSDEIRVAVRRPDQLGAAGAPLLVDDPAIAGPLGGLASALRFAREAGKDSALTVPCDMPFVPSDLPDRLAARIGGRGAAIAASGGEIHPVCALWRVEALDRLPAYLETGRRSLRRLAEAVGFVAVEWPCEPFDPFFNINSEADLQRAEQLARGAPIK